MKILLPALAIGAVLWIAVRELGRMRRFWGRDMARLDGIFERELQRRKERLQPDGHAEEQEEQTTEI